MAEQSPSSSPQDGSGGSESLDNLVLQAPQPMREDYIQNAVKFLSHPKVKGSPVFHRRSFLEKKGLTKEELDEAFRRVPDSQPNSTDAAAVGSQQANNPNESAVVQPYTAVQSPQAATGSVTAGTIVPHTKAQFSWVHGLLGAGLFVGFGASTAITLKKLFIPRLKSWTRRVIAEGDESANDELNSKIHEEIKEAIKISASAFSDIARTNEEVLASKDEDRKILIKLTEAVDSQANVLKSLSETLNHIRENRFSQYNLLEENIQPAPWNGPIDNQWRASQQTNMYTTSPNSGFDSGRHSFMPLPAEPTYGSFSGSYPERVQRPGGYGFQPQTSNDRSNPGARSSYHGGSPYHHTGNAIDSPAAVAAEFQRRWVPPHPPGVILPEAAAAIRQPRSIPRQQSQSSGDGRLSTDVPRQSEPAVGREQMNGASESPGGGLPSDGSTMATNAGSNGNEGQELESA
ncbi:peroxisomal membrane protein PEX14-like isoform X2 [Phragmites australis]|uniref:peroxisomal membrane protein PEX14-like isoform X2 n=1 Tax=Phragmites australis TaxID=29695 RepID=UPI002D77319C|nr:peroxisomal membrane protein PEX14-like isoform X2 [Phragmites australis]